MSSNETAKKILKEVRPILSLHRYEARRRVISLYKAWYRQIPYIIQHFDVEMTEKMCKAKLREEFTKYGHINDIRIIDMLVIKGQMNLKEASEKWVTRRGIAKYFDDPTQSKPSSFLGKFLEGHN
ncbi:NADH dehydrogenase [ubiquinone] 1 alpha subcomplex subunit 6-like [Sitophilus oryzae]|uniref:NADH dehydrogenase [ubiquinone] 1 alpha subcomplex subunit 6 n=1 Tax=Sitophilus oryzae TaxID=7048 RepID=A0A6J2YFM8_SITOR|nr:NADH dehydrogenase [ubiquinone] 1 alpha subcomplex subunit 6-like [Sitophilus oryzae]